MDFDTHSLRVFSQVMQDKTFSEAARSLNITQPTVSQQIAKLEGSVGKLFQRVGHKLVPSSIAEEFQLMTIQVLEQIEGFEQKLHHKQTLPQGLVRYAMPESCQWTPHYRSIMRQIPKLPDIRFQISILPNDEIIQHIREAKVDFGFVVGERLSAELRFKKFSEENYSAVGKNSELFENLSPPEKLGNLRWVAYPGWELFFNTWARHHDLSDKQRSRFQIPTIQVGTLAGAIHAIQEGVGVGVIPSHCIEKDLRRGTLIEWVPKKKDRAFNPIYLAHRVGEKLPRRVEMTIKLLSQVKLRNAQ